MTLKHSGSLTRVSLRLHVATEGMLSRRIRRRSPKRVTRCLIRSPRWEAVTLGRVARVSAIAPTVVGRRITLRWRPGNWRSGRRCLMIATRTTYWSLVVGRRNVGGFGGPRRRHYLQSQWDPINREGAGYLRVVAVRLEGRRRSREGLRVLRPLTS